MRISASDFELLDKLVRQLEEENYGYPVANVSCTRASGTDYDRVLLLEELQLALQQARDYQAALFRFGGRDPNHLL